MLDAKKENFRNYHKIVDNTDFVEGYMITVIVPVYNVEKYLNKCVDSILQQTYTDFELILVDDGSPDNCPKICDEYEALDSRIKVIHKKNGGLSSARNEALNIAKGDYITFVDSDDWIAPYAFEYLLNLILTYDAEVVSADYEHTKVDDVNFEKPYSEKIILGSEDILKFYMQQDNRRKKNDYPVWIKLYKKESIKQVRFPDGKLYEDIIFNFKILKECKKYVKSSRIIYAYNNRNNSITKSKLSNSHFSLLEITDEMLQLIKGNSELEFLCMRKKAMSYLTLLAMYVRYGTCLEKKEVNRLVREYKKIKHFYIKTEKNVYKRLCSFLICVNVHMCRSIYCIFRK